MKSPARRPSRRNLMFRVTPEGTLAPADEITRAALRRRKFRIGDVLAADPKKPRNLPAWRRAHRLAQLLIESLDEFEGGEAHQVLKRLQIETGIGCEELAIRVPGVGMCLQRIPRSMAFDEMDDGEFNEIYAQFCQHVIGTYWPDLTPEQIDQMASLVGMAA